MKTISLLVFLISISVASAVLADDTSIDLSKISGQVVISSGAESEQEIPAVGFPLQVVGPEGETTIFTDNTGKWSAYDLPPGNYTITPSVGLSNESTPPPAVTFEIEEPSLWQKWQGVASIAPKDFEPKFEVDKRNLSVSPDVFRPQTF